MGAPLAHVLRVVGDKTAGNGFLRRLSPFVWRKHLDYAAIRDIHSLTNNVARERRTALEERTQQIFDDLAFCFPKTP